MDWSTVSFTGITTEVTNMLTDSNIIASVVSIFALIIAVRLAPRIIKYFTR